MWNSIGNYLALIKSASSSSSSSTMSVVLIGLQFQLDSTSPPVSILRQMVHVVSTVSTVYFRPSPLCRPPICLCGLPLLFFSAITPNITVLSFLSSRVLATCPNSLILRPYRFLHDGLLPVHSTEYCVICFFLCSFQSHYSAVTLAFERQ